MPTKIQSSLVYDNSSDANFRSWGSTISANLATLGWVKTSDTGQINWTTVTKPGSTSTFQGYEIWKGASSANQTACPIFFRLDYGSSGSGATIPGMKVQFGTGSNGSGTISGGTGSALTFSPAGAAGGASTFECDFYGDGSKLAILMWRNNANAGQFFIGCERNLSGSGVEGNTYYTYITGTAPGTSNGQWNQNSVFANGTTGVNNTQLITIRTDNNVASSWIVNSNTPLLPVFPMVGFVDNPLTIIACIKNTDAPGEGTTFTTPIFGSGSHTYLVTKSTMAQGISGVVNTGTNAVLDLAMRFE